MTGKERYKSLYQNELKQESEWLRFCAVEKVNSIEYLLNKNSLKAVSMLELGCGTGAVLQECQRRGLAQKYTAVDYSEEAINYIRDNCQGINAIVADLTDPEFAIGGKFDVVVLSHVLEHLETPAEFLESLSQKIDFSYLTIEVPLEDLFVSKLKSVIKDRSRNKAGHIEFFNAKTFRERLSDNFIIMDSRRYLPILNLETIRFLRVKDGLSSGEYFMKLISRYVSQFLSPLWMSLCYAHYACLCQKISVHGTPEKKHTGAG